MKRWWIWFYTLRRGDWLAVILGIVVVGGAAALWSTGYLFRLSNFGFGPDWRCSWQANSEPVCVKDEPPPAKH